MTTSTPQADRHIPLIAHRSSILALTFSPNGLALASADENEIHLWNAPAGWAHVRSIARPAPSSAFTSAHGRMYLAAGGFRAVGWLGGGEILVGLDCSDECLGACQQHLYAWALRGGEKSAILDEVALPQDAVHNAITDQESGSLFCCSRRSISAWTAIIAASTSLRAAHPGVHSDDRVDLRRMWRYDCIEDDAGSFIWAAAGAGRVFVVCAGGGVVVLDAVAGAALGRLQEEHAAVTCCCYAPSRAGAGGFPPYCVLGTADGAVVCAELPGGARRRGLAYDPGLRDAAARGAGAAAGGTWAGGGDGDGETGRIRCGVAGLAAAAAASGAAAGAVCARLTEDQTLTVIDLSNGQVLGMACGHIGMVTCVAWLRAGPGRARAVSGCSDESVGVWEGVGVGPDDDARPGRGHVTHNHGGHGDGGHLWRTCGRLNVVDVVRTGRGGGGEGGRGARVW